MTINRLHCRTFHGHFGLKYHLFSIRWLNHTKRTRDRIPFYVHTYALSVESSTLANRNHCFHAAFRLVWLIARCSSHCTWFLSLFLFSYRSNLWRHRTAHATHSLRKGWKTRSAKVCRTHWSRTTNSRRRQSNSSPSQTINIPCRRPTLMHHICCMLATVARIIGTVVCRHAHPMLSCHIHWTRLVDRLVPYHCPIVASRPIASNTSPTSHLRVNKIKQLHLCLRIITGWRCPVPGVACRISNLTATLPAVSHWHFFRSHFVVVECMYGLNTHTHAHHVTRSAHIAHPESVNWRENRTDERICFVVPFVNCGGTQWQTTHCANKNNNRTHKHARHTAY